MVGIKRDTAPDYALRRGLVQGVFDAHLQQLVDNLVTAFVFVLPPFMHHEVAETLFQLQAFSKAAVVVALDNKLKTLSRVNSNGSEAVTQEQVMDLRNTITGEYINYFASWNRFQCLFLSRKYYNISSTYWMEVNFMTTVDIQEI